MPRRPLIVVVGSINTDLILPIDRLPKPGETLAGGDAVIVPGGKGANQAVAAARLGADVAMVGRVGRDAFGPALRDGLAAEGIDVRHVRLTPGATGTATILLQAGGENSIVLSPGANARVTPADVDAAAALIRRADAVLLQLEVPPKTVHHAMRIAKAAGVPTVLDPAPAPTDKPHGWLLKADVLSPNQTEAEALLRHPTRPATAPTIATAGQIAGRPVRPKGGRPAMTTATARSPDKTAASLAAAARGDVVLKLGADGSLHADASGVLTHARGFTVDVIDTTAAGDAFTAALAVARAGGATWADTLRFANAAGALACTKLGARPSLPTRRDVMRLNGVKR